MLKVVGGILAVLLIGVAGYALMLERGAFEMPRERLEEKYTTAASRFIEIDGVRIHYDMNRRAGYREESAAFVRNFRTGDPQAVLERLTMPTLIGWGVENATVMHLEADVMSLWMTGAPTRVIKYPGLGHYLYIEEPQRMAEDIIAFLEGSMDQDLRMTQRVPVAASAGVPAATESD